jgi:small subunit ribosomal protein S9
MAKAETKEKAKTEEIEEKETLKQKVNWFASVGRRKRSIARVRIWLEKNGKMVVNEKPVEEFFPSKTAKQYYESPLVATDRLGSFAVSVKVSGGGSRGQLAATVQGLANALVVFDEKMREPLARKKLLTRDPREKERRKYGYAGKARARKQSPKR